MLVLFVFFLKDKAPYSRLMPSPIFYVFVSGCHSFVTENLPYPYQLSRWAHFRLLSVSLFLYLGAPVHFLFLMGRIPSLAIHFNFLVDLGHEPAPFCPKSVPLSHQILGRHCSARSPGGGKRIQIRPQVDVGGPIRGIFDAKAASSTRFATSAARKVGAVRFFQGRPFSGNLLRSGIELRQGNGSERVG